MTEEIHDWNIVIENSEFDNIKNKMNKLEQKNNNLEEENTKLKIENKDLKEEIRLMKKKFEESKIFLNKNMLYPTTTSNYLDKKPFYLNYKYRFNSTYQPNYYQPNYSTIGEFNDFTALKEQYIPVMKYL
jgi:regulator of replication initiation timing